MNFVVALQFLIWFICSYAYSSVIDATLIYFKDLCPEKDLWCALEWSRSSSMFLVFSLFGFKNEYTFLFAAMDKLWCGHSCWFIYGDVWFPKTTLKCPRNWEVIQPHSPVEKMVNFFISYCKEHVFLYFFSDTHCIFFETNPMNYWTFESFDSFSLAGQSGSGSPSKKTVPNWHFPMQLDLLSDSPRPRVSIPPPLYDVTPGSTILTAEAPASCNKMII